MTVVLTLNLKIFKTRVVPFKDWHSNTKFRVPQSKMHQFYTFSSKWDNMVGHDSCIWLSCLSKLVKILMIPLEVPTLCNRKCQKQLGISKWRNCNPYQWKWEGVHFSLAEVKGWNVLQEKEGGEKSIQAQERWEEHGEAWTELWALYEIPLHWLFRHHECSNHMLSYFMNVDTLVWPRKFH